MHLRMEGIGKRFGALTALVSVDFEARPGEVTALLGENGAGKSTLMKILYGMHRADSGLVSLDGTTLAGGSPREAVARGVGMVFQQFSLIPALTVRENLALALPGAPWLLGRGARRLRGALDVAARLRELAPDIDPDQRVSRLSVGQLQLVELAKVLNLQARLVVLDEPTAVLAPAEAQRLWALVRVLRESGLAVVLITHKLQDVHACADRIAVLRGGRLVASQDAAGLDDAQLVALMVGEHLPSPPPPVNEPDAGVRLWIKGATASGDAGMVSGIELQLRAGELLGVAGISGNGQTTLAEAVAGIAPLTDGEIILDGLLLRAPRVRLSPSPAVAYIPEQPLRNAVAPDLSLAVNLAVRRIAALPFFPDRALLEDEARLPIQLFGVRPSDARAQAQTLSGGNLQKLVAARELSSAPAVVVACYPTMGLDVTATAQIYEALFELARRGTAVLWISEDLGDLLRYSHRIAVMLGGRAVKVLDTRQTQATEVGAWMTGACAQSKQAESA